MLIFYIYTFFVLNLCFGKFGLVLLGGYCWICEHSSGVYVFQLFLLLFLLVLHFVACALVKPVSVVRGDFVYLFGRVDAYKSNLVFCSL